MLNNYVNDLELEMTNNKVILLKIKKWTIILLCIDGFSSYLDKYDIDH